MYRRNQDSQSTNFSRLVVPKKSGSRSGKKFKKKDAFDKSKIKCFYCNKLGHFKSECQKLAKDNQDNASKDHSTGSVFIGETDAVQEIGRIWIADYGEQIIMHSD